MNCRHFETLVLVLILVACSQANLVKRNENGSVKRVAFNRTLRITQPIGQIGGISFNQNGHLVVFHRADRIWDFNSFIGNNFNTLFYDKIPSDVIHVFNANLNTVRSWGRDKFFMPHGLTIDHENNMWLTDVGLHQVFKYNLSENLHEPQLTLGVALETGNDAAHFCKPTTVAVATSTGDIFVGDGYCNSRVVRFSKSGAYIREYADADEPIQNCHAIALIETLGLICSASRENGRVVCFDVESGKKRHTLTDPDMRTVYAIKYDRVNQVLHAAVGRNREQPSIGLTFAADSGDFGKLIQKWNAKNHNLVDTHDIAISNDGTAFYLGQLNSQIDAFEYK